MSSATDLIKERRSETPLRLGGPAHLAFKFRSLMAETIPPGRWSTWQRVYERLTGRADGAAQLRAHRLRMLNLGYVERGYQELLHMAETTRDRKLRLDAYWELINWHLPDHSEEGALATLRYVEAAGRLELRPERRIHLAIAKASALAVLNETARSELALQDSTLLDTHPDLILARAALLQSIDERHSALNAVFAQEGLSEVALMSGPQPAFDRLTAGASETVSSSVTHPSISVIVPVYNAQATIETAIRALQQQTQRDIEIIVVDDCSSDETAACVAEIARQDGRVRLLRMDRNSGAYSARNRGLEIARGTYVTCHDADDWSHPDKLRIQMQGLERRSQKTVANFSGLLFLHEDLRAAARRVGSYARKNTSSLMFRRQPVVEKLGAWDTVRFAADTEFLERIYAVFGRSSVSGIARPLSLIRHREGSLTASRAFGYHGFRQGARHYYHQRYQAFHRTGQQLRLTGEAGCRPFYVPTPMREPPTQGNARRRFDVVLVFDCRLGGADLERALDMICEYRGEGLTLAIFHLPLYAPDPERSIHKEIVDLLDRGALEYLVPGERVACDTVHILKWGLLLDHNRFFLDVKARRAEVTMNDPGKPGLAIEPSPEARQRCSANLRRYCDAAIEWSPI